VKVEASLVESRTCFALLYNVSERRSRSIKEMAIVAATVSAVRIPVVVVVVVVKVGVSLRAQFGSRDNATGGEYDLRSRHAQRVNDKRLPLSVSELTTSGGYVCL
jgi:hypothetical protein